MKNQIISYQNEPIQLERMYRTDKIIFKKEFNEVYPALKGNAIAEFWNTRLNFENDELSWGSSRELVYILLASIMAGIIAKFPAIFELQEDYFYPRNIGFILFPVLTTYFAWKNKLSKNKIIFIGLAHLFGLIYINSLPKTDSDTLTLSCMHIILYLWGILAFAYVGNRKNLVDKRLDFLKYNGDLIVMTTLILLAGGLMSAVTIGLFSLIGFNIETFYFEYIVIFGLPGAPIFATYLTQTNPHLVGKVSPVIAKIFSPLVFVMLTIYLAAMAYAGKDPYTDREFLLIFNALLLGVMALIFFSLTDTSAGKKQFWILFLLSILTIVVNGVALSAILFRIAEWGITPNRLAVLGSNLLILSNLALVTIQLFKTAFNNGEIKNAGKVIALFLPVYLIWAIIVTFLFPFIFGFG